jgi:RNA polymerase sigma-70 factor (ECF subfamily)
MSTIQTKNFQTELVEATPFLRAFARTLCHDADQAEDLAQEALLKAWQCRQQFQLGTNLRAWLATILRNRYYSQGRRRKWQADYDHETIERTLVAPDDPQTAVELEDVRRALRLLPDFQREAVILIGAGGMSYEEVAQIAGCPLGTVKSRVRRARDELQSILVCGRLPAPEDDSGEPLKAIVADFDSLSGRQAA